MIWRDVQVSTPGLVVHMALASTSASVGSLVQPVRAQAISMPFALRSFAAVKLRAVSGTLAG